MMNQQLMNVPGIHPLLPNPPKIDINNAYPLAISQPINMPEPEINQINTPLSNIFMGTSA